MTSPLVDKYDRWLSIDRNKQAEQIRDAHFAVYSQKVEHMQSLMNMSEVENKHLVKENEILIKIIKEMIEEDALQS